MANILKDSSSFFSMNFIANSPDKKAAKNPKIKGRMVTPAMLKPFPLSSKIDEPIMMGIEIKKEKRAMVVFSFPSIMPVEMVLPLLDSPGSAANPCTQPMMVASIKDTLFKDS